MRTPASSLALVKGFRLHLINSQILMSNFVNEEYGGGLDTIIYCSCDL